jgi:hypothetical protein
MTKRTCSIEGCGKPFLARGWCKKHWSRWSRTGDPTKVLRILDDPIASFWSKVDRCDLDECWPWLGAPSWNGYGIAYVSGRQIKAHRYSYSLNVGPISDGLQIDHVWARGCRRRDCVNPFHLEAVTSEVNTARSDGPTARDLRKTHCPKRHPLIGDNIYVGTTGGRRCRTCRTEQRIARRAKERQPA